MENKYKRNGLIYFLVIIVTIVVYLVIHIYYTGLKNDIYQCNAGQTGNNNIYTVKTGDNLETIAKMYKVTVEELKKANNITSESDLIPGQELIIPKNDNTDTTTQPINSIIAVDKDEPKPPIDDDKKKPTEITSISFAQKNINIKKGDTQKLIVEVKPVDLISTKLTWKSSDPSIVSVDGNGNITGLKEGTATITVISPNGKTASVTVTVVPDEVKVDKIILNPSKLELTVGASSQVSAKVEPENATNRELVWESSNPSVATVDDKGVVTGISPGTTTITVKTKDGTVVSQITVTVKPAPTPTPVPATPTPTPLDDNIVFEYDYDEANYIYLINQFPIKDEVGKHLQGEKHTQDFKIKVNDKAEGVKYTITAEKLDGSDLKEEWTKLFLVNDGSDVQNCYRTNNRVKSFNEYAKYNGNAKEVVLYNGVITNAEAVRGYKDFTFRMWVSEDLQVTNSDYLSETKTFKVRINVYAEKE